MISCLNTYTYWTQSVLKLYQLVCPLMNYHSIYQCEYFKWHLNWDLLEGRNSVEDYLH